MFSIDNINPYYILWVDISVIKPWLKIIPVKWYDIISLQWNDIISLHGLNCPIKYTVIIWLDQYRAACYILAGPRCQIWQKELLYSFIKEMAASIFVNVSDEDISLFLEDNLNENTTRKTSQDVAFKTFLRERKLNDPEQLTLLRLYFNLVVWFF